MPKATITLDDTLVDGLPQVSMSLFLPGGFDKESHAHQHAGLLLKYLDSIAGVKTDEAVKCVEGASMPEWGAAPAQEEVLQLDGANGLRLVTG
jgi:hypothetical protein